MVQLGRRLGSGPASLAEIAVAEDLPRAYLEQLVMSLRDAGLVVSTRGAHGGYELSRPPDQIRMSDVLHALEGPIAPMICASDDPEHATICGRSALCTVNVMWLRVRDAISGALDGMTLADLVPARLLHVDIAVSRTHAAREPEFVRASNRDSNPARAPGLAPAPGLAHAPEPAPALEPASVAAKDPSTNQGAVTVS